jgi:hypothetical protein
MEIKYIVATLRARGIYQHRPTAPSAEKPNRKQVKALSDYLGSLQEGGARCPWASFVVSWEYLRQHLEY